MTGVCAACGPIGLVLDGHRDRLAKDGGRRLVCKVNKADRRRKYKRWPHGLTGAEAREFIRDRMCEICQRVPAVTVDHCHDSRIIRGALCTRCNVGIGMLGDDPEVLRAAIAYLTRDRTTE